MLHEIADILRRSAWRRPKGTRLNGKQILEEAFSGSGRQTLIGRGDNAGFV
jgi:hypothetical protein